MINREYFIKTFKKAAAVIMGCFFFLSCENSLDQIRKMQEQKLSVDEVKGVTSYLSKAGVVKAKLTAPYMLRYFDSVPRVEFPHSLHVDFYDDSTRIKSYLNAKQAEYFEQQGRVVLRDSVVVISIDGDTLKTDELFWDQNLHKLYTTRDVEIRQRTKTIFGKGFESDEQLKNFKLDSITGVLYVGASKFAGN